MLTYADRLHEALVRVRVNLLPKLAPGHALCLMPYALCLMPYASGQPCTNAGSRSRPQKYLVALGIKARSYALCIMPYALCLVTYGSYMVAAGVQERGPRRGR